ncbi:hypothetical protein VTJ83DRAFT_3301 [Remersonia thermophila]|uniref:Uncharacterized protein n=1 Tax=Remersonia thermophila TaxID=72144 RepID=A0ABR4DEA3_9PEZI
MLDISTTLLLPSSASQFPAGRSYYNDYISQRSHGRIFHDGITFVSANRLGTTLANTFFSSVDPRKLSAFTSLVFFWTLVSDNFYILSSSPFEPLPLVRSRGHLQHSPFLHFSTLAQLARIRGTFPTFVMTLARCPRYRQTIFKTQEVHSPSCSVHIRSSLRPFAHSTKLLLNAPPFSFPHRGVLRQQPILQRNQRSLIPGPTRRLLTLSSACTARCFFIEALLATVWRSFSRRSFASASSSASFTLL